MVVFLGTSTSVFTEAWGLVNSFIFLIGGIILLGRRNSHGPVTLAVLASAAIGWFVGLLLYALESLRSGGWDLFIAVYVSITAGSVAMLLGITRAAGLSG